MWCSQCVDSGRRPLDKSKPHSFLSIIFKHCAEIAIQGRHKNAATMVAPTIPNMEEFVICMVQRHAYAATTVELIVPN